MVIQSRLICLLLLRPSTVLSSLSDRTNLRLCGWFSAKERRGKRSSPYRRVGTHHTLCAVVFPEGSPVVRNYGSGAKHKVPSVTTCRHTSPRSACSSATGRR